MPAVEVPSEKRQTNPRLRYDTGMRDLIFIAVVVAFFAIATVFVAACERIVGCSQPDELGR